MTNSIFHHGFRALLLLLFTANTTVSADTDDPPAKRAIVAQVSNVVLFTGDLPVLVRYEWEGPTEKRSRFGTVGFGSFFGDVFVSAGGGGRWSFLGTNPRGLALDLDLGALYLDPFGGVCAYISPGLGARWTLGEGGGDWTGFILDLRLAAYVMMGSEVQALPYGNLGVGFGF